MGHRRLVIVGVGGFGRETAELVQAGDHRGGSWTLAGFVDDAPPLRGTEVLGFPVLGPAGWVLNHSDVDVVVCLNTPRALDRWQRMVERLRLRGSRFATLVHPAAVLARSAVLGVGTVIHAATVLTANVVVGAHVHVMPCCVITHDDRIGDFATLGAGVRLAGGVIVGHGAYIGSGALVREGITIGDGALIGMGAVVLADVPSGETWIGVPAGRLDRRSTAVDGGWLPRDRMLQPALRTDGEGRTWR